MGVFDRRRFLAEVGVWGLLGGLWPGPACATAWRMPHARITSPVDARLTAAITTFRVEGVSANALQDALWARKVRVRAQSDANGVRFSAHIYLSPRDIDTVVETVATLEA